MIGPKRVVFWVLLAGASVAAALGLSGCSHETDPWPPGKPRVLATFPPLYCFTRNIAPDAAVLCMIEQEGPHGREFKSRDVLLLREADLFVANGLGLDEHFTRRMRNSSGNHKLVFIEAGEGVPENQLREVKEIVHGDHTHTGFDPHVWLGPPQAREMVRYLAEKMAKADPEHAEQYRRNAKDYAKQLDELEDYGKKAFANKKNRKFATEHDSMYYFARAFGLTVAFTIQDTPGGEVPSVRLSELTKKMLDEDVHVIAVEPQYGQSSADALINSRSLAAKRPTKVTLDPLETFNPDDGELDAGWYVRKMRQNIDTLAKALK